MNVKADSNRRQAGGVDTEAYLLAAAAYSGGGKGAAAVASVAALAIGGICRLRLPFLAALGPWEWAFPLVGVALAAWWPGRALFLWRRTGFVTTETIGATLAVGCLIAGAYTDAAIICGAVTAGSVLRASFLQVVRQPAQVWRMRAARASGVRADAVNEANPIQPVVERLQNGVETTVAPRQVVPADGILLSDFAVLAPVWPSAAGATSTNPAEKYSGAPVWAGEVNVGAEMRMRVEQPAGTSAVELAAARTSAIFASASLYTRAYRWLWHSWSLIWSIVAVFVGLMFPLFRGNAAASALLYGLAFLALSIPGAWQGAADSHYLAALASCIRRNILPINIAAFEKLGKMRVLAVVTERMALNNECIVGDVLSVKPRVCPPLQVLALAGAVVTAARSSNPAAAAIRRATRHERLKLPEATAGEQEAQGFSAMVDGHKCLVGAAAYMRANGISIQPAINLVEQLAQEECEPFYVVAESYVLGVVGVAGLSAQNLKRLKTRMQKLGIRWFDIAEQQDGQYVMRHPSKGDAAVNLMAGQEMRTLRSWLGRREGICVAGDGHADDSLFRDANLEIALGPAGLTRQGTNSISIPSAHLEHLPTVVTLSRKLPRKAWFWGICACVVRLGSALLVIYGKMDVTGVVTLDMAMLGMICVSALRTAHIRR